MDVASFVSTHKAFLVAGVIVVGLVLMAYAQEKRRDGRAV